MFTFSTIASATSFPVTKWWHSYFSAFGKAYILNHVFLYFFPWVSTFTTGDNDFFHILIIPSFFLQFLITLFFYYEVSWSHSSWSCCAGTHCLPILLKSQQMQTAIRTITEKIKMTRYTSRIFAFSLSLRERWNCIIFHFINDLCRSMYSYVVLYHPWSLVGL